MEQDRPAVQREAPVPIIVQSALPNQYSISGAGNNLVKN
jgi:hypothetical protein